MTSPAMPHIAFLWDQFGAYHMDRCEAVAETVAGHAEVIGIELSATSTTYAWDISGPGRRFLKRTLFGETPAETLPMRAVTRALAKEFTRPQIKTIFLSGYERPSHFAAAVVARAWGKRVIVMLDSKYDDKPRKAWLEASKRVLMSPYHGGFAAGPRSADYLRRLGLEGREITLGYDSVSLNRIRSLAAAYTPLPWHERPFLAVARYVPKKNLNFLLGAYAAFLASDPASPRRLVLCGGGPLEATLRAESERLEIAHRVDFTGFVGQAEVARLLKGSLCLLLPSIEEQWGLVVNEALAFSLPIMASPAVGATDILLKDGCNGFLRAADDRAGWSEAMLRISSDETLWRQTAACSEEMSPLGDVSAFVQGVMPHLKG